jgi:hypothetical protein
MNLTSFQEQVINYHNNDLLDSVCQSVILCGTLLNALCFIGSHRNNQLTRRREEGFVAWTKEH